MLDVFIPGFTTASAAFEQLLTGDAYSYAHLACFFGMLAFLSSYARKLGSWLKQYLSESSASRLAVCYSDIQ